jgi:hypothetical protein
MSNNACAIRENERKNLEKTVDSRGRKRFSEWYREGVEALRDRRQGAVPHRFTENPQANGLSVKIATQAHNDPLEILSKRDLITLLRRQERRFDDVDLAQWQAGIVARLKVLRARASEGKFLEEASEFARWVVSSGLFRLFLGQERDAMERVRQDVLWACESAWNNKPLGVLAADAAAVGEKVDRLCSLFSRAASVPSLPQDAERTGASDGGVLTLTLTKVQTSAHTHARGRRGR